MPGVGTTHHLALAGHYYLVKPGSYRKSAAPVFGARFSTGDPDYNNLSIWQHWAQRCFVGGMGADVFMDDAMYDEGVGVNTAEHEKVTLTRDLGRGIGSNWTVSSGTAAGAAGGRFCVYNGLLYFVSKASDTNSSVIWQYDPVSDGWASKASPAMTVVCIAAFDGKLFVGGRNTANTAPILKWSTGAIASWTTTANPAGVSDRIFAMRAFQSKFYVAYGATIWRQKDDQTWDGSTAFYKANQNSESNGIVAFEVHLGFLYMISSNGHVHRTDGNTSFDIWSWDGGTRCVAIKSFDGRLFIVTYEFTNTAEVGFGVLYQMSGSAMTELKRWGKDTESTIIGSLTVYDHKLWYGASNLLGIRAGFGVAVYDPIEDAHSIAVTNSDTVAFARGINPYYNYIVDDVFFFGGYMFVFVRGHGAFKTPYKPKDIGLGIRKFDTTPAGGSLVALNGGWFTTSTYDAGTPGVLKLWRKVALDASIPSAACGIVVDYSVDDGTTWVNAGVVSAVGVRKRTDFHLNNIISVSLKLRFTLRSTDSTKTPTLLTFVVSYLPVPEPNWMWNFSLVLSASQDLLDGTVGAMDTEAEMTFLRDTFRTKQLVHFDDIDGSTWATAGAPGALIYDISFVVFDINKPLEGEVNVTLVESVETY